MVITLIPNFKPSSSGYPQSRCTRSPCNVLDTCFDVLYESIQSAKPCVSASWASIIKKRWRTHLALQVNVVVDHGWRTKLLYSRTAACLMSSTSNLLRMKCTNFRTLPLARRAKSSSSLSHLHGVPSLCIASNYLFFIFYLKTLKECVLLAKYVFELF